MKNIAIFGSSRAGKSTLARMLNNYNNKYQIISGDSIRHAFQFELPKNEINKFGGKGMVEDYSRFCSSLFKNQIKRNKEYFNYIFDSCDVSVLNAVNYFKDEDIYIVFLGYSHLTPEEAVKNYRKYEKNTDWTVSISDEELLKHAEHWINNSKIYEKDCNIYGIDYVDTSHNREEVLNNLFHKIINECK